MPSGPYRNLFHAFATTRPARVNGFLALRAAACDDIGSVGFDPGPRPVPGIGPPKFGFSLKVKPVWDQFGTGFVSVYDKNVQYKKIRSICNQSRPMSKHS